MSTAKLSRREARKAKQAAAEVAAVLAVLDAQPGEPKLAKDKNGKRSKSKKSVPPFASDVLVPSKTEEPAAPAKPPRRRACQLHQLADGSLFTFDGEPGTIGELIHCNGEADAKVKFLALPPGSSHTTGKPISIARATVVLPGDRAALLAQVPASKATGTASSTPKTVVEVKPLTELPEGLEVACSAGKKGGMRYTIFGIAASGILRWMGAEGWTFAEANYAVKKMGLQVQVPTFKAQMDSGRRSGHGEKGHHGVPAELTKKQAKILENLTSDMPKDAK